MHATFTRKLIYQVCLSLASVFLMQFSQGQSSYSSYTMKDGLPSNLVYRCVEDNKGFLWVATDAGIARFDGKYFQVFTTSNGLPDNEVLSVVKEQNGRIWVNCFKQSPAYFDEKVNRFINASTDSNLAKVSGTSGMFLFPLPDGGVVYHNEKGSFVFKDNQVLSYGSLGFFIGKRKDGSIIYWGHHRKNTVTGVTTAGIYEANRAGIQDSFLLHFSINSNAIPFVNSNSFYLFSGWNGKCYVFRNLDAIPVQFRKDSFTVPEPFINYDFTSTAFYILGASGKLYIYDKKTLEPLKSIEGEYLANSFYNDSKGNEWISTIDKGLIVYRPNRFGYAKMEAGFNRTNFLSVAKEKDGTILAGNFYGEIIESGKDNFKVHKVIKASAARQRKIIVLGKKVFTFSDMGSYVNFTEPIVNPYSGMPHPGKTAVILNDTSILVAFSAGMLSLHPSSRKVQRLNVNKKRVTAITRVNDSIAYFGSTDGLYRYERATDTSYYLSGQDSIGYERVTALAATKEGLLWVGTGGHGITVIWKDKKLLTIKTADGIIDNSVRCLAAGRPGTVWVGTSHGISIISYHLSAGKLSWSFQNISTIDGLTNNETNDMLFENDTMFIATGNGISILPASVSTPALNISLQMIGLTVGAKELGILNVYDLDSDEQSVTIQFAGVDLGGRFSRIQYKMGEKSAWINSRENTLNLQLSHGGHVLYARAVDINGHPSDQVFVVEFNVATPFYNSIWFMIIIIAALQIALLLAGIRWVRNRRRIRVAKNLAGVQVASLEQQAFTSLMNPHFIFNALNSIQHYINLQDRQKANRYLSDFASLIRKNFDAAQRSFVSLEEELESVRIYLRLEEMRFKNKFTFEINLSEDVDPDQWMVPTMMMQPILENAILHGIMPSSLPGLLELDMFIQDKNLHITITDNGIGMENSRNRKSGNHKSSSMELIRKRVSALSRFVAAPIQLHFSIASDEYDNPGNKTTIIIPADLYRSWQKAQDASVTAV